MPGVQPHQAAQALLQHPPQGRQALPLPAGGSEGALPPPDPGPAHGEGRREVLRPLHRRNGGEAGHRRGAGCVPPAHLQKGAAPENALPPLRELRDRQVPGPLRGQVHRGGVLGHAGRGAVLPGGRLRQSGQQPEEGHGRCRRAHAVRAGCGAPGQDPGRGGADGAADRHPDRRGGAGHPGHCPGRAGRHGADGVRPGRQDDRRGQLPPAPRGQRGARRGAGLLPDPVL